jgi:hypothetical protein
MAPFSPPGRGGESKTVSAIACAGAKQRITAKIRTPDRRVTRFLVLVIIGFLV